MNTENFIMPMLSLVIGVISLFTDPKDKRKRWLFRLLIIGLVLASGLEIFFRSKSEAQAQSELQWSQDRIKQLISIVESFRRESKQSFSDITEMLSNFGWQKERLTSASVEDVQESFKAEQERQLIASNATREQRRNITIQYFPKDVDKEKVKTALRELGFQLQSGRATLPGMQTNAIWFGNSVPIDAVKLVAYTLIRAGIKIRTIQPFQEPGGRKAKLIQVGSYASYASAPVMTVEELRQKTEFIR